MLAFRHREVGRPRAAAALSQVWEGALLFSATAEAEAPVRKCTTFL